VHRRNPTIGVAAAYGLAEDWHAQAIARAAERAGDVRVIAPEDLAVTNAVDGRPRVMVGALDARTLDVVLMARAIGDRGDADVQLTLYRALEETGVALVNPVGPLLAAIDKLHTSLTLVARGIATPAFAVAQSSDDAERALESLGEVVGKPIFGSLGLGVERLSSGAAADHARVAELLDERGALYLQKFVPAQREVRAIVVGHEVVAAVARRPRPDDFRANAHQGGEARATRPTEAEAETAVRASRALGLEYAGVDLITGDDERPLVLEVNGTPSFRVLSEVTGRDVAAAIVAHAVQRTRNERRKGQDHGR
jgi:tetrahydromethanopterin:alpha-L-glutamate ligase